jgi:DNA-directed RNA polymerase subunit M/transcription elongation factor TFIIS
MPEEEKVKWRSLKKYTCKRNKGEHEYLEPTIKRNPTIRYVHKTETGTLDSHELHTEHKYLHTTLSIWLEAKCKHCGHKATAYINTKIK